MLILRLWVRIVIKKELPVSRQGSRLGASAAAYWVTLKVLEGKVSLRL